MDAVILCSASYSTEPESEESVAEIVARNTGDQLAVSLVGIFLLGILIGLMVFKLLSERWHT